MKVCVIIYHSNLLKKYKYEWIVQFLESIYKQTYKDFDLIELNYGSDDLSLLYNTDYFDTSKITFINQKMKNHIKAQNFLLDYCFNKSHYDVVLNTNVDDYYDKTLLEKELKIIKDMNVGIVSSNFKLFQEIDKKIITKNIEMMKNDDLDIQQNFMKNKFFRNDSRLFQNSGCCITKTFYKMSKCNLYEDFNLLEVLFMCKKMIKLNKFYIIPEILINQRIHKSQLSYDYR